MNKKALWLSVIGILISFVGGFLLANALNRSEINSLRSENERFKGSSSSTATAPQNNSTQNSSSELSGEEIRQKILEADQNPTNFAFQKNLGLALYSYASSKKDTSLMNEAAKLLLRANQLEQKDYDVVVGLGHLYFDLGEFNQDNASFARSREFYQKALEQRPKDVDVRTDYGLTFFLQNPPDNAKAVEELKKSLQDNPSHEKTLDFLTQALIKENKRDEAARYLAKLKEVNPANPSIKGLEDRIEQAVNSSPAK